MVRTLVVVAVALLGCSDGDADRRAELRIALEVSDAALASASLPPIDQSAPAIDLDAPRMWLGAEVRLDLAPVERWRLEPTARPEPFGVVPLAPLRVAQIIDGGALVLPGTLDPEGHTIGSEVGSVLASTPLRRGDLRTVVVLGEPEQPSAPLAELASVLGHMGTRQVQIAVATPDGPGALRIATRPFERDVARIPRRDDVGLQIRAVASGLELASDGGVLAGGCAVLRSDALPTVPHRDGAADLAELERCLAVALADERLGIREVFVVVEGRPLGDVVRWLAAIDPIATERSIEVVLLSAPLDRLPTGSLVDVLSGGAVTGPSAVFVPGS